MKYSNAVLVRIDDDHVVIIDGVKYLVMIDDEEEIDDEEIVDEKEARNKKIVAMFTGGYSRNEIATELGLSYQTVYSVTRKYVAS